MARKLTYDEVKDYIESRNECKLISEEYKNNRTTMLFLCKCGEYFETNFFTFAQSHSHQCKKCDRAEVYLEIKEYVENTGCKLISREVSNKKTNLFSDVLVDKILQLHGETSSTIISENVIIVLLLRVIKLRSLKNL